MIIKNAKKNEPWEVESFWEWIPSQKRKLQANQEALDSKVLPFEKIYTKQQSKSRERDTLTQEEKNLRQTLNIQQWNPNSPNSKDRPLSAKLGGVQANKKTLQNNFMKETAPNIFTSPQSQYLKELQQVQELTGEIKPLTNKQKKKFEEEKRKYDEFRKYQTEMEAKEKNKNLLYFNVRFPHLKTDEYYKIPNGWEKTPLIEEMPQSPPKGRIPNDLIGQPHVEGNKLKQKQKIEFYKEDKNEMMSSIQDGEEIELLQKDILAVQDVVPLNNKDSSKNATQSIFTNKKLQEQRESAQIQKEINKLLEKNKQNVQPKTGKEVRKYSFIKIETIKIYNEFNYFYIQQFTGIWCSQEKGDQFIFRYEEYDESIQQNRCNVQKYFYNEITSIKIKIKDRGFPGGMEFADEHMEEMNEIKEKLENRSIDQSLEIEMAEMEYDQGKRYDEIQKKQERKKNKNKEGGGESSKQEDNDENNVNDDMDMFGEAEVDQGDQAVGSHQIPQRIQVKKTTFLTQEKVEVVPAKISKTKDIKLKSKKAQEMEDLMNELDLGDDQLLEEYDEEVANSVHKKQDEGDNNNLSDSLEEKPKKPAAKKEKFESKRVQFYNGKVIRKPKKADEELEDELESQKQKSVGNILNEVEEEENNNDNNQNQEEQNDNEQEEQQEIKSQKSQPKEQSVKNKSRSQIQNDSYDVGEDKKQMWQKEVLQGHHRAYMDEKQNFDYQKFVQDVDEETRDKCKEKVKGDIKKLEDRTQKKLDLQIDANQIIKGGSTHQRSQQLKEKSEKLDKINSKFKKSLQSIKDTLEHSKKESAVIERKPSAQKLLEKTATKILKETQKNTESQKKLKIDNATVNEIKKHEFKFSQREKINDEEPHPWL